MNNCAILPYIGMHALQIQNVKRNVVKKASIKELNNEIVEPSENVYHQDPTDDTNQMEENNQDNLEPSFVEPVFANDTSNIGTQID